MLKQVKSDETNGKTIKATIFDICNSTMLQVYQDGTFMMIKGRADRDGDVDYRDVDYDFRNFDQRLIIEVGVSTKEEIEEENRKRDEEWLEKNKEHRRKQFETLKKEFDNEGS